MLPKAPTGAANHQVHFKLQAGPAARRVIEVFTGQMAYFLAA